VGRSRRLCLRAPRILFCFFFQAEDGIRDFHVTGVQTCALPIFTVGPLIGASTHAASGRFDSISVSILAEPFWAPLRKGGHTLFFFPSVGGSYLEVKGVASGEYVGQSDSAWVVTTGGGMGGHVRLGQHFGVTSEVRALFLLPRPVVQIGGEEKALG